MLFTVTQEMELSREHFRWFIFYYFRRGLSRQEGIVELTSLFGNKAPSYSTVKTGYIFIFLNFYICPLF